MNEMILADYIQKWGSSASIALFDPACQKFCIPSTQGVIGYRDTPKCIVVFGDPVCAEENIQNLTRAFHDHCRLLGKTIIYIAASEKFMQWILNHKPHWSAIEIGNEIILDPCQDPKVRTGSHASLLRNKYNQAQRIGITVKEYCDFDQSLQEKLEAVGNQWLSNRKGPQIHFGQNSLFSERSNKRWFYATKGNSILGLLVLNCIADHGWVQNLLMICPTAPKITSEVILLSTLEILGKEGCKFYSTGPLPAAQIGKIEGLGSISQWLVRKMYSVSKKIFKLGERQRFWKKFEPHSRPTFVLFSSSRIGITEVLGIMRALNAKISKKSYK